MEEKNKAMGQESVLIGKNSVLQELTEKVQAEQQNQKKQEETKEIFKNNIIKTGTLIRSAYIYDEPSKKQIGIIGKGESINYTDSSIEGWVQLSNGGFISKKWIK